MDFSALFSNPVAGVFALLTTALLGAGGRGFWLNMRKDRREAAGDATDLMDVVRKIAQEEVSAVANRAAEDRRYYDDQLTRARVRIARLEEREEQLTDALRQAGVSVPPWKPEPITVPQVKRPLHDREEREHEREVHEEQEQSHQ